MKTQNEKILKHLKRSPITPLEAIRQYGILLLGARIYDLRRAGYQITRRMVEVKTRDGKTRKAA